MNKLQSLPKQQYKTEQNKKITSLCIIYDAKHHVCHLGKLDHQHQTERYEQLNILRVYSYLDHQPRLTIYCPMFSLELLADAV